MHMQMRHAFARVRSAVDHDSIAAGELQLLRHVARNQKQFAEQRSVRIGSEGQFLANEADNFLTQRVTGARPCFRASEMLHTKLQRRKPKIVSASLDQSVDSLFQQTEKRKLVARTGTISDIHQRNRNG